MANEEQQYPDNGTYLFWITEMLHDILGRILPLDDALIKHLFCVSNPCCEDSQILV